MIPKVSVIIPIWSEVQSLKIVTEGLYERIGDNIHDIFFIVAPQSSAACFSMCQQLASEHPKIQVMIQKVCPGLGHAYKQVFPHVTGTHVLIIDADNEMDLETVPKMVAAAANGYDLVLPSRWIPDGGVKGYDTMTYILNRGFQFIFRIIYWTRVHDLTYGFKLFNAKLIKEVDWWGEMHEIAMETTLKPLRLGYKWIEIPTWWKGRTEGVSKINTWKRWRYVLFALRIRFTDIRGKR